MDNSDFNIDRLLFYNSESIEKGDSEAEAYDEGIEVGELLGKKSVVLEMLKNNFDVDLVARLSKLPKEKIEEFKNELK